MPFTEKQSRRITDRYICAQCYRELQRLHVRGLDWYDLNGEEVRELEDYIVICPEHGNVETVGRVTKYWAVMEGQKRITRADELKYIERQKDRVNGESDPVDVETTLEELGF